MITLQIEIDKENFNNFDNFLMELKEKLLNTGREIIREALESRDNEIMRSRDKKRFRSKGKRKTCLKTWFGAVEYERQVYADLDDPDDKYYVYLLDEEIKPHEVGYVSKDVCKMAAQAVVNSSYRAAAQEITEMTGLSISPQGVWNIIQQIGKKQREKIETYSEQAQKHQLTGAVESKIVYEENDGIWLKLQGQSRKDYGASREMKVGIAYDGATWKIGKGKKKRRTLDNKVAYAAFESSADFRKNKEGLLASRFIVDEIELRVINGDGAQWIQKRPGVKCISVLDKFHRNKKITECVKDGTTAKTIRKLLYSGQIQEMMDYIEAMINSVEDPHELSGLKELRMYYSNNLGALTDPYSRGIEIPETIHPGVVHYARLGSMESNVFTLVGNRMKGRRATWSINGANNLSAILCAYHISGMESLFQTACNFYQPEPQFDVISNSGEAHAGNDMSYSEVNDLIDEWLPRRGDNSRIFDAKSRPGKFSGGEQRLLQVFSVIATRSDSDLLIIDEPLNNLDFVNARYISNLINKVIREHPQMGLLMISHCRIFPFITRELKLTADGISEISEPYTCHSCFGEHDENGFYK